MLKNTPWLSEITVCIITIGRNMQMDESVSHRLRNLAIIAMLAVVWLHGYPLLNSPNAANWNLRLQSFLWLGLTRWAVPAFFMMSGLFFCWSLRNGYVRFYQKKLSQCLVPYLLWCCFGAVLLVPLKMLDNYRRGVYLLVDTVFESEKVLSIINRFFAITYHGPSVNGPLWYLRTLLVVFLFAPIFYELCKKLPAWVICIVGILGLLVDYQIPFLCINVDHIAWFTLGIGIQRGKILDSLHAGTCFRLALPTAFCWLAGVLILECFTHSGKQMWFCTRGGYNAVALLGVASVYFLLAFIQELPDFFKFFSNTFWFYCCHFPICMWIRSIGRVLACDNDLGLLAVAVLTPVLTLLVVLLIQMFCRRFTPLLFACLSGGR